MRNKEFEVPANIRKRERMKRKEGRA